MSRVLVLVMGCLMTAACRDAGPAEPPYRSVANMKQLMEAVIDPAADTIWESVGTIMTPGATTEVAPQSDDEWMAVQYGAIALAESSNLLLMPNRSGGNEEWMAYARQLIDLAEKTSKAAEAKNPAAVFDLGAEIYDVCANCHRQFIASELSNR